MPIKANKKIISEVMRIARQELCALGMRKRTGEIYTCKLNEETLGWIGLNRAIERGNGMLEINPVIGVRNQSLEKVLSDIRGEKFHTYIPPSTGIHLGYLMPQKDYVPWLFAEGKDNTAKVKDMVVTIMKYGKPFMKANDTLETLCDTMANSKHGIPEQTAYRLPIAYFLLGERDKARKYLATQLKELGNRTDLAAQQYRRFATEFSKRLNI